MGLCWRRGYSEKGRRSRRRGGVDKRGGKEIVYIVEVDVHTIELSNRFHVATLGLEWLGLESLHCYTG